MHEQCTEPLGECTMHKISSFLFEPTGFIRSLPIEGQAAAPNPVRAHTQPPAHTYTHASTSVPADSDTLAAPAHPGGQRGAEGMGALAASQQHIRQMPCRHPSFTGVGPPSLPPLALPLSWGRSLEGGWGSAAAVREQEGVVVEDKRALPGTPPIYIGRCLPAPTCTRGMNEGL